MEVFINFHTAVAMGIYLLEGEMETAYVDIRNALDVTNHLLRLYTNNKIDTLHIM